MKVVRREVKTIDTIEFDAEELLKIVQKGQRHEGLELFQEWGTGIGVGYCQNKMSVFNIFTSNELTYIAHYFNYDNWEHCGGYVAKTHKYRMTVYCYGDLGNAE